MDAWRAVPVERERYLRFLMANWAPARAEVASGSGAVLEWRVVTCGGGSPTCPDWDYLLVTVYRDSSAWARREALFAPVLRRRGMIPIDGKGPRELARFVWEAAGPMPIDASARR